MLEFGTPTKLKQPSQRALPLPERQEPMFNPKAQLDTSRVSNVDERSNPLVPSSMYLRTNNTLPDLHQIEAVQSRANEYLKSKLNRMEHEPEVNKLLMLVKLLGGRV